MLLMSRYGVRFTEEMTKDLFTRLTNQQNQIIIVNITKNRDYFYIFLSSCIRTILWQTYTNDWMWTGFWAILYDRKHKIVYQFGR